MKVVVAKSAGFCFGVRRAVALCEKAAVECQNCVTLGPIIHNEHVVRELEAKGIRHVTDISGISPDDTVIIRSHGVAKNDSDALAAMGVKIIDATCPYVEKIHGIVREEHKSGRLLIIIGERRHPETLAISSWCDVHEIFETVDELSCWLKYDDNAQKPISIVYQTTNTETIYETCSEIVKKVCTNYKIFDTICSATFERQQEAASLSKTADIMIVIGGKNSANSLRLADICREHCSKVIFTENLKDLENANICKSDIVGITAGASTPAWIIKEVTQKMSEEVRLDETCLEQENVEQASPVISEESAQEEAPSIDSSDFVTEDTELLIETEITSAAVEKAEDPELIADPQADPADVACDVAAIVESEEVVASEPAEEADESPPDDSEQTAKPVVSPVQEETTESTDESASAENAPISESFEEMLEKSIKTLHTGQKVTGVVTSITATEVSVDLGTKQSGYIPISEFTDDVNTRIEDIIKIGDSIESFVMRVNDVEGMVMLSKKRLDAIKNWDVIEAAKENRTIIEGFVTEENKGGVVVNVKGVRVFIPASQTGLPKSAPMSELVRKPVKLRITEVNQSRRRVVGSIRAVQADERREKSDRVWNDIEVGKQYKGVVKSMTSYGVFVDIGGVDGMIHISELSWTRIKQPSEVMAVGDEVSVYVLSFDKENRKISLGYKKREDNPWTRFTKQHSVGDVVNVKIVKMMPFGAFAEICPGVDGLIHISQITDHRIGLPSEVLSDGQLVDVKITEIDLVLKKVSLSIRALIDPTSQPVTDKEAIEAKQKDKTPTIIYNTDDPQDADSEAAADNA